jgi:hypothetical protein
MQLFVTIFTWGVVVLGLLVMMQAVRLEEVGKGIRRAFLYLVIAVAAFWCFRSLVLPILLWGLVWLKQVMLQVLIALLLMIGCAALLRVLFLRLAKQNAVRTEHKEEL